MPEKILATIPFPTSLTCPLHPVRDFTFYSRRAFDGIGGVEDLPCGCVSVTIEIKMKLPEGE